MTWILAYFTKIGSLSRRYFVIVRKNDCSSSVVLLQSGTKKVAVPASHACENKSASFDWAALLLSILVYANPSACTVAVTATRPKLPVPVDLPTIPSNFAEVVSFKALAPSVIFISPPWIAPSNLPISGEDAVH